MLANAAIIAWRTFLTLINLYAFRENWQSKTAPALLLCLSLGLLFYTNYLLFFSFFGAVYCGRVCFIMPKSAIQSHDINSCAVALIIFPGLFFFASANRRDGSLVAILANLKPTSRFVSIYVSPATGCFLFWRWGRLLWTRSGLAEPRGKIHLISILVVLGNILLLTPAPQGEMRYLIYLYPLCAVILGWIVYQAWRYQKFSGASWQCSCWGPTG